MSWPVSIRRLEKKEVMTILTLAVEKSEISEHIWVVAKILEKNLRLVLVIQPDKRWGNQQNRHHCSSGKDLNVCNKSCAEASQRRWHSNQSMAKKGELSIYCIFVLCPSTALLYNSFLFTDASLDFYARQSGCDLCIPVQGLMRILPCLLQKPLQCFCPHLSQLLLNCALLSVCYTGDCY